MTGAAEPRQAGHAPARNAPRARDASERPRVLVITGPSGVGKGTLIQALRRHFPGLELSVSATTRPPRPSERDGREYHFLDPAEFERRASAGEFVEHAEYAGNRYGTLRSEVERAPDGLVLEIEVKGARQVRDALRDAVQVFIAPPSPEVLRERLLRRGTDQSDQIARRLAQAEEELRAKDEFEHVIENNDLERASAELVDLVATIWPTLKRGERT
ncbi:MAG: guanylate kinase [Actinobacteria bacterium]|nr:guanylate kinase [Actinomycetota bacterium]